MNVYKVTLKSYAQSYNKTYFISASGINHDECEQLMKAARSILIRETQDEFAFKNFHAFEIEYLGTLHNYEQEIRKCNS